MTLPQSIPNHKFWPTGNGTALLAIDTGVDPNENYNKHTHLRFPCHSHDGAVELGSTPGPTCAIYKVAANDTIRVTSWDTRRTGPLTYDVLPDLKLQNHEPLHAPRGAILGSPKGLQDQPTGSLSVGEEDLELLFSKVWPQWLRPPLETQLSHWRIHHVEHYYHYIPWEMSHDDLWRCVRGAPAIALRRFGAMLTNLQREICCRNAPLAAATYAFPLLSRFLRQKALEEFPDEVLRHAVSHLSDAELMGIAAKRPLSVFRCHRCMPGKQRAFALSVALKQERGYFFEQPVFSKELLLESLVEFPEQWLAGMGGDFEAVFTVWADRLGWIPDGHEMMEIHRGLDAAHQRDFMQVIARRI